MLYVIVVIIICGAKLLWTLVVRGKTQISMTAGSTYGRDQTINLPVIGPATRVQQLELGCPETRLG